MAFSQSLPLHYEIRIIENEARLSLHPARKNPAKNSLKQFSAGTSHGVMQRRILHRQFRRSRPDAPARAAQTKSAMRFVFSMCIVYTISQQNYICQAQNCTFFCSFLLVML
ncbi:MAG: hypothetical protein E6X17_16030 [Sporomusaceae bacterium]|nr:hypothetical protein [Sporomusaceae bacterium]